MGLPVAAFLELGHSERWRPDWQAHVETNLPAARLMHRGAGHPGKSEKRGGLISGTAAHDTPI